MTLAVPHAYLSRTLHHALRRDQTGPPRHASSGADSPRLAAGVPTEHQSHRNQANCRNPARKGWVT